MASSFVLFVAAAASLPATSSDVALDLRNEISPFLSCMRSFDAKRASLAEKERANIREMERVIAEKSASEEKNRDFNQKSLENGNARSALKAEADKQCNPSLYLGRLEAKIARLQPDTEPTETARVSWKIFEMFQIIDQDIAYYQASQHPIYPSIPPPIPQTAFSSGGDAQFKVIPEHFRGEWRQDLCYCNSEGDTSVLKISQNQIVTQLENGKVDKVAAAGPHAIEVVASWAFGRGSVREQLTETYTLSENGDRLSDKTYFGSESWRRCPVESKEKNAPNK